MNAIRHLDTDPAMHTDGDGLPIFTVDLREAARRSESETREWTDDQFEEAFLAYRRFFALAGQGGPVAPTRQIDMVWHLHMLSPVAYYRDCMEHLGMLLDHDGGFGQQPEEADVLAEVFLATAERYLAQFGAPYVAEAGGQTSCWHDCQGRCWHACKSVSGEPELRIAL